MRAARSIATVILSFLLFVACTTTRKATTREEAKTQLTVTTDTTAGHRDTGAAFLNQQTTTEGKDAANITITFERWEFAPYNGAPTDSSRASPDVNTYYRNNDQPPDGRLASFTKGAINISREGARRSSTSTQAGATVEHKDTVAAKTTIGLKTQAKTATKTETEQRDNTALYILLIMAALIWLSFRYLSRRW